MSEMFKWYLKFFIKFGLVITIGGVLIAVSINTFMEYDNLVWVYQNCRKPVAERSPRPPDVTWTCSKM